jgi:hypothetical protein
MKFHEEFEESRGTNIKHLSAFSGDQSRGLALAAATDPIVCASHSKKDAQWKCLLQELQEYPAQHTPYFKVPSFCFDKNFARGPSCWPVRQEAGRLIMATRNLSKSSCMEVGDISDVSIEKCSVIL